MKPVKILLPIIFYVFVSCRHEPIKPVFVDECLPIPSAQGAFGYERIYSDYSFTAPFTNPTNNEQISFVSQNNSTLQTELALFDLKNKSRTVIAKGIYYWPKWSSNGLIAYDGTDNNVRTINTKDLKTSVLTSDGKSYNPDISPDGRYIVFERDNLVYHMNADGTDKHLLFDSLGFRFPAWSPDGKKIAFLRNFSNKTDLIVFDTASHSFQVCGQSKTYGPYGIGWFPDSHKLIWANKEGLYLASLTNSQVLIKEGCESKTYGRPTISADGKTLIVERTDISVIAVDTLKIETNLYLMNVDGNNERKIEF